MRTEATPDLGYPENLWLDASLIVGRRNVNLLLVM